MALSVTTITRAHGPQCKHLVIAVDHEGVARQFQANEATLDETIALLGGAQEAQKALVLLWLAYRRQMGRSLTGVVIA